MLVFLQLQNHYQSDMKIKPRMLKNVCTHLSAQTFCKPLHKRANSEFDGNTSTLTGFSVKIDELWFLSIFKSFWEMNLRSLQDDPHVSLIAVDLMISLDIIRQETSI